MAKKRVIMLTNLMLHTRSFRPTGSFENAREKAINEKKEEGRIYSHLPEGYEKDVDTKNHTFRFQITLPPDLQQMLKKGEAVLAIPEDGLTVYAGRDTVEFIKKRKRKEHRQVVHRKWGEKDWRDRNKGI